MKWKKKGLIYTSTGDLPWAKTHAMIPTPDLISDQIIRLYITCCDENGMGRVGYIDVDANTPSKIIKISEKPVLDIGIPGTFDENGVLQCSILTMPNGQKYLYYVGFELGQKIRYRLLTGLAISTDGGNTFTRVKKTPVLERSDKELYFRCGPFVILDNNIFKLWYVAGSEWTSLEGKEMPIYDIRYQESRDGIHWADQGTVCIKIEHEDEHGFGRPYVIKDKDKYRMFYSVRRRSFAAYRMGYAESLDGIHWVRQDHELGLDVSASGWDSNAIMYAAVIVAGGKTYLFYNGNDFGKNGFGYAVLESW